MGTIDGPTDEWGAEPGADSAVWTPDQAVAQLYAAHWRGLVRLAWLLLHDQQVAEDVVQEAFVSTYRRWASLRSPHAAVAYLRTATVNGSRSALRKRGVRERYAASQGSDVDRYVDSAESFAIASHNRDEVMTVLAQLPVRQREVLVLRYYLDLSEADIAETLGISRGAVKSHASRGISTLRGRLTVRAQQEDLP